MHTHIHIYIVSKERKRAQNSPAAQSPPPRAARWARAGRVSPPVCMYVYKCTFLYEMEERRAKGGGMDPSIDRLIDRVGHRLHFCVTMGVCVWHTYTKVCIYISYLDDEPFLLHVGPQLVPAGEAVQALFFFKVEFDLIGLID